MKIFSIYLDPCRVKPFKNYPLGSMHGYHGVVIVGSGLPIISLQKILG